MTQEAKEAVDSAVVSLDLFKEGINYLIKEDYANAVESFSFHLEKL